MLDEIAFDAARVHELKKPVIIDSPGCESHVVVIISRRGLGSNRREVKSEREVTSPDIRVRWT
jgi:hypothetical protein